MLQLGGNGGSAGNAMHLANAKALSIQPMLHTLSTALIDSPYESRSVVT
jgi:hypothetical protein